MARPTNFRSEIAIAGLRLRATAWAWYLHGGGGGGKSFSSLGGQVRRPSRFQVEALKKIACGEAGGVSGETLVPSEKDVSEAPVVILDCQWDCGSSLYDSYELVTLCKNLDSSAIDGLLAAKTSEAKRYSPESLDSLQIVPKNPDSYMIDGVLSAKPSEGKKHFTESFDSFQIVPKEHVCIGIPTLNVDSAGETPEIKDDLEEADKEAKHCGVHNFCNIIHILMHLLRCNDPASPCITLRIPKSCRKTFTFS